MTNSGSYVYVKNEKENCIVDFGGYKLRYASQVFLLVMRHKMTASYSYVSGTASRTVDFSRKYYTKCIKAIDEM